jgi:HSP20 family protein
MNPIRSENGLRDPFQEFEELQEEINKLFDMTTSPAPRGLFERSFSPALDVIDTTDDYQVLCDLPGLDMEDIEISISGNVLTLKGEKRKIAKNEGARLYREETSEGRFQRTLQLPMAVDPEKAQAVLSNGVLRITIPKREEVKPKRIEVKAS